MRRRRPERIPVDVVLVAARDPARFAGRLLATDGVFEAEADATADQLADPAAPPGVREAVLTRLGRRGSRSTQLAAGCRRTAQATGVVALVLMR